MFGRQLYDWPVLACETVRFIGDRVAAVAAETREAAEAAANAIDVTYEELPAVFDAAAALADDAPVLHPDWSSYYFAYLGDRPKPARAHPNIQGAIVLAHGEADLEPIFARAHRVFEHTFRTPRQHAGFVEPRSTVVWLDGDGRVHVYSPNKTPFSLRRQLARVAGIGEEQIVIETSAIGGDFGGKGLTIDEFPCYFLAKATGRPVRYVQTYADELRNGPTRHRTVVTMRTAVDADGMFLAHASTVLYDGGAYAAGKPIPTLLPGNGYGAIPYRVPNVRLDMRAVYTNALPAGHVRGPSEIQTFYAWEQHVEMIAEALGCDAGIAFRRWGRTWCATATRRSAASRSKRSDGRGGVLAARCSASCRARSRCRRAARAALRSRADIPAEARPPFVRRSMPRGRSPSCSAFAIRGSACLRRSNA